MSAKTQDKENQRKTAIETMAVFFIIREERYSSSTIWKNQISEGINYEYIAYLFYESRI